jgi:hypothetical protein
MLNFIRGEAVQKSESIDYGEGNSKAAFVSLVCLNVAPRRPMKNTEYDKFRGSHWCDTDFTYESAVDYIFLRDRVDRT